MKDYVINGGWNWNAFANKLPSNALLHIASIKPPDPLIDDDIMFWGYSKNGEFTIESAYRILSMRNVDGNPTWRLVWGWMSPERIKKFYGLLCMNDFSPIWKG